MPIPTEQEIRDALKRAAQEIPQSTKERLIDVAWQILSWEFPDVEEKRIKRVIDKR